MSRINQVDELMRMCDFVKHYKDTYPWGTFDTDACYEFLHRCYRMYEKEDSKFTR